MSENYKNYAHNKCANKGWSENDYNNLDKLWTRESNWNPNADNGNGCYGIPQCNLRVQKQGEPFKSNPYHQIDWGIDYIKGRYGNPTAAYDHFKKKNWY